ncbi:hypothetical protein EJ05DRAFT_226328 [Pseudovirgaria hyperparasitica]|uniref:Uncharacterized protein n=1 Tax=Pseudovirgaria hyperparasitica TaxID=470096 RepID=A0A6A6VU43_9PEZI|nr:uncharacterized protein EJ05DRAFT_226328 [Pseudovirgaria hyperparasitica]KAF2753130.1 hypothetical protein EJ05DRAFT_226328 [Pseudovirgaria hyperparasitica]
MRWSRFRRCSNSACHVPRDCSRSRTVAQYTDENVLSICCTVETPCQSHNRAEFVDTARHDPKADASVRDMTRIISLARTRRPSLRKPKSCDILVPSTRFGRGKTQVDVHTSWDKPTRMGNFGTWARRSQCGSSTTIKWRIGEIEELWLWPRNQSSYAKAPLQMFSTMLIGNKNQGVIR